MPLCAICHGLQPLYMKVLIESMCYKFHNFYYEISSRIKKWENVIWNAQNQNINLDAE